MLKSYIVTPPAADEGDGLTFCAECGGEWPESELNNDNVCPDCLLLVWAQAIETEDEQC